MKQCVSKSFKSKSTYSFVEIYYFTSSSFIKNFNYTEIYPNPNTLHYGISLTQHRYEINNC